MLTTTDFNLAAATAARIHLVRVHEGLRVQIIHAWLMENRNHPRAKQVDELMTSYRLGGVRMALDDAELLTDRYAGN